VRPEFGPGPFEAVEEYLARNPGRLLPDGVREGKFGCTFATRGYFRVV
jgi:cephalosporin hydroxylase